ncbi:alpha/beta fold hydrolase [bacterium]|nr:alpha/beta fold hydrolase [bacterium]
MIVLHGLEGNAERAYMRGMCQALNHRDWDVVCYNFQGCSGESNLLARAYHSGETDDLETVIQHVTHQRPDHDLALIDFSLGGNIVRFLFFLTFLDQAS